MSLGLHKHRHTHMQMYVLTHIHTDTQTHNTHKCTHKHTHACVHTLKCMHTYAQTHTYGFDEYITKLLMNTELGAYLLSCFQPKNLIRTHSCFLGNDVPGELLVTSDLRSSSHLPPCAAGMVCDYLGQDWVCPISPIANPLMRQSILAHGFC